MVTFRVDDDVVLREFEPDDAESIYETAMANYEHLSRFVHWMTPEYTLESAHAFISASRAGWEERRSLPLGIFRNSTFIGATGFVRFDWHAQKAEIGYWIAKAEEGKGIITSACRILIGFAFQELGLNRIEIKCSAENVRSSAVPKRLGFLREGLLRQAELRDGRFHDYEIYGLLASEWKS